MVIVLSIAVCTACILFFFGERNGFDLAIKKNGWLAIVFSL